MWSTQIPWLYLQQLCQREEKMIPWFWTVINKTDQFLCSADLELRRGHVEGSCTPALFCSSVWITACSVSWGWDGWQQKDKQVQSVMLFRLIPFRLVWCLFTLARHSPTLLTLLPISGWWVMLTCHIKMMDVVNLLNSSMCERRASLLAWLCQQEVVSLDPSETRQLQIFFFCSMWKQMFWQSGFQDCVWDGAEASNSTQIRNLPSFIPPACSPSLHLFPFMKADTSQLGHTKTWGPWRPHSARDPYRRSHRQTVRHGITSYMFVSLQVWGCGVFKFTLEKCVISYYHGLIYSCSWLINIFYITWHRNWRCLTVKLETMTAVGNIFLWSINELMN